MATRCLVSAAVFGLIIGAGTQERFTLTNFQNPSPYAFTFQPLTERPREFHQQQYFQGNVQPTFQQPFVPPFPTNRHQQDLYEWQPKQQFARNVSLQQYQVPFKPLPLPQPSGGSEGLPPFFQDPQFEQLFQQELKHQIELERQRIQGQPLGNAGASQQPKVEVEIMKSQQLEQPQLQDLQGLHQLLQGELRQHEFRQREQQRQQQQQLQQMIQQQQQLQNQVEPHELFMSQRIKPQQQQLEHLQQQRPLFQQQQQQQQQQQLQQQLQQEILKQNLQQTKPQQSSRQPNNSINQQRIRPQPQQSQNGPQLDLLDLNQFLPFLQTEQKLPQHQQKEIREQEKRQQQQKQQEQRLKQQQRLQVTLKQQEERRLEEQKHKEKLRQQRLEVQQLQRLQQQKQQQEEQEQKKRQRQQRQQPLNNNGITAPGGNTNKTEKPIKSVRDLFNTSSCIDPPLTCPHPRIHFYLYTRTTQQNPDKIDVTDPDSLRRTPFNPQHPIKVLIHGFQGGRQFSPSTDLRKAYFIRGDYNIFVVDYNSLVRLPCLSQIQWSPSFLALCISQLVGYVGNTHPGQAPPDRFHLIGYSIGAHVAGLVANYVNDGKLGRITGLDPTIIFYQGSNRSHDLDPSDAHFIDVIHTGAGILGQRGPNGHVDYYVNGGTTQPGCQSDSLIKTLSCDHTKVSPYYVESIVTPVGFWALPCPNLFMYLLGFCQPKDEDYILMGEDAPHNARGIYYLTTNANKPYAKGFPGKRMPTKFPKWRPH